jgi:hypothetical protein
VINSRSMSVAVLCNLSDGAVIGVDSAMTVQDANGIQKVFEDGEKLFQLATRIGIAAYGLAGLEGRSIGSFISEFERNDEQIGERPMSETVERLRAFFYTVYTRFAESLYGGTPFDQIQGVTWTSLGLIVAGFSPGSFFSEAWEIRIPVNNTPGSSRLVYGPGAFGLAWFAASDPIERYLNGFDPQTLVALVRYVETLLGRSLTPLEIDEVMKIRNSGGYKIMTDSMPIQTGISYVRFLVQFAINHYRFAAPHPIVGGKAKLGVVTYRREDFQMLEVE